MKSSSTAVSLSVKSLRAALAATAVSILALAPFQAVEAQALRGVTLAPVATPIGEADWRTIAPENLLVIDTTKGRVLVEMDPQAAPAHVARMTVLADRGFYDGLKFHRVIPGFMAQTGDPTGTGMGGSERPNIPAEFSSENFGRGVVGMARSSNPNSANSQFFIVFDDATFLDRQYTVWGQVIEGMEHVDALPKGEPPRAPGKIVKATVN